MSDCTLMTDDEPAPKRPKVEKGVSGTLVWLRRYELIWRFIFVSFTG